MLRDVEKELEEAGLVVPEGAFHIYTAGSKAADFLNEHQLVSRMKVADWKTYHETAIGWCDRDEPCQDGCG